MPDNLMTAEYQPPKDLGLDILFIDDFIIAVNKPSGLLSVPGRGAEKNDSLLTRTQKRYPEALAVHRLDMGTSGIIVLARNKNTHRLLSQLFEQRLVTKQYSAMVDGRLEPSSGTVEAPLLLDWPNRPRQKIDYNNGKQAITHYERRDYHQEKNISLLVIRPVTGRSHQIRVHLSTIGHAILGDTLYASGTLAMKAPRLLLHADYLSFSHPNTDELLEITCPSPFLFKDLRLSDSSKS